MRVGNIKWKLAIAKLEETVKLDDELFNSHSNHRGDSEEGTKNTANITSDPHTFENTLKLYLQYLGVLKELEEIYNDTVHPQKRESIQTSEVLVVSRIIQLRHYIAKANPSYLKSLEKAEGRGGGENPIPSLAAWEYTDISFHRFSPQFKFKWNAALLPTIPTFFRDQTCTGAKDQRDTLVRGYIKLKLEGDTNHEDVAIGNHTSLTKDAGVASSVSNENGNGNGKHRQNKSMEYYDYSTTKMKHIENKSAIVLQKHSRSFLARRRCKTKENTLLSMIGMAHERQNMNQEQDRIRLKELDEQKKFQQVQNKARYKDAVTELKDEVQRDKGFGMKQLMRSMRIQWATEKINETNQVPESMDEFYNDQKKAQQGIVDDHNANSESSSDIDKVGFLVSSLKHEIAKFAATWKNPSFDGGDLLNEELAKNAAEKQIESELQKDIDMQLISNFKRIKSLSSNGTTKSTKKGDKSKSKKKAKGKKKKEKPLPGDKIAELKGMDTGHIVSILVSEDLLRLPDDFPSMADFVCLEEAKPSMAKGAESRGFTLPYPNLLQIKRLITEYCIMPLGCAKVREHLMEEHFVRSLLLYGPRGSGKSLLARIVAKELGALFIDISPRNISERFLSDKIAATKLIHMIFTLARDPMFAPIVIYMSDCEKFFQSTKKKKGSDNSFALKFQKELLIYKNQALKNERVIIIGSTTSPWEGDMKQMKWKGPNGKPEKQGFWEHFLYVQNPTYVERSHLWKHFIKKHLSELKHNSNEIVLNHDVLSQFSEGYTAGAIEACVKRKISLDRLSKVNSEQMEEVLLTSIKAKKPIDAGETYRKFTMESMMEEKGKSKSKKKKK